MNNEINKYKALELKKGFYLDKYYENFQAMTANANSSNWEYNCTYQLLPNAISGHHQILHLKEMQVAYSRRDGGIMQDIHLASDTISIAVMENCVDKVCFHKTKLKTKDIIFFDGGHSYNLITNNTMRFRIVTIKKEALGSLLSLMENTFHKTIKDSEDIFLNILKETWEYFTNPKQKIKKQDFNNAQTKIINILKTLLDEQTPKEKKLTKGEKIALNIRKQVYTHMDGNISINSLSKEHNISEKTMQNSFKSLFGFTPKKFLQLLKLNLVYHDLKYSNSKGKSIQQIANKWGFMHMGNFSNYYTKLFKENPSKTLLNGLQSNEIMTNACVSRKEEII